MIAIFRLGADARAFAERIDQDEQPLISAAALLECSIVARAFKEQAPDATERWIDEWLISARMHVEPLTNAVTQVARTAHVQFGKGTGHPARLNFGDCFSYALAKSLNVPPL